MGRILDLQGNSPGGLLNVIKRGIRTSGTCWSRSGRRSLSSRSSPFRHRRRRPLWAIKEDFVGKADFHMHTSLNDGTATVREVLNYIRDRTDLDVIAITDHDRLTGSYEALGLANEYRFDVVAGCEITTLHRHLLALFIDKPIPMWRPLDWTIGKIHEQGGLAIAVHPFSMLTRSIGFRSFDGIMRNGSPEIY